MREYFARWGIDSLSISGEIEEGRRPKRPIEELLPEGFCSLAFISCFPYAWTFEHGGWFRWVPRRRPLIKWQPENRNLSHYGEVLVTCPNPYSHVLFGISPVKGSIRIRVIEIKGNCLKKHAPGQTFHIYHNDALAQVYYQIYPYYCAEATRSYQTRAQDPCTLLSGPEGQGIDLSETTERRDERSREICHISRNGKALRESAFGLHIEKLPMPCRYQRAICNFASRDIDPMEGMCLDAAWSAYPSALAALYDAHPKKGRFFNVSCPSAPNRIIWEVRTKSRYSFFYTRFRRVFFRFLSFWGICIDRPDKEVKLRVKEVIGECSAGYRPGTEFLLNIRDSRKLCPATFVHFYPLALQWIRGVTLRWTENSKSLKFNCPDVHGATYCLEESYADDGKIWADKLQGIKVPKLEGRKIKGWKDWYLGKTVVVTGGNSGIGFALAREIAKIGATPVICGRDKKIVDDALESLRSLNPRSQGIIVDLTDSQASENFIGELKKFDSIHILINNAGLGTFGDVLVSHPEALVRMIRINVEVLTVLTARLLPAIVVHGADGGILNLGSFLSWFPPPGSAAYGASKAYVLNFTEALRYELRDIGVHVCGLYPGGTRSQFAQRSGLSIINQQVGLADPDEVARAGLKGLALNKARIIPGRSLAIKTIIMRMLPARIRSKVL